MTRPARCLGRFREQEDAYGYFMVMRETVTRFGIPMAAYADRHSIFYQGKEVQLRKLSLEEQLTAKREPTQFGRLLAEPGVHLIHALSPQAKARVERLWGTFQDRLASELRLAGARNCEQATRCCGVSCLVTTGASWSALTNRRRHGSSGPRSAAWMSSSASNTAVLFSTTTRSGSDSTLSTSPHQPTAAPTPTPESKFRNASTAPSLSNIAKETHIEPVASYRARRKYSTLALEPPVIEPKPPQPALRGRSRRRAIIPGDVLRWLDRSPRRQQHAREKNRSPWDAPGRLIWDCLDS
jgi:hypothetical protein